MKVELADFPILNEFRISTFEVTVSHICSTAELFPADTLDLMTYTIDDPEQASTVASLPEISDSIERDTLGTAYETKCGLKDFSLAVYPDPDNLVTNIDSVLREVTVHAQQGFTQLGHHDYEVLVTLRDHPTAAALTLDLPI